MRSKDKKAVREKIKTSVIYTEKGRSLVKNHYIGGYFKDFIFFDHARGSRVFDVDGNEYIDFAMGLGPLILGHNPDVVTEAIEKTLKDGLVHSFGEKNELQLAELLIEAIPCADKVAFANSGTEATMYALKVARAFTGKEKIGKFEGAYHGNHDYAQISGRFTQAGSRQYPEPAFDHIGIPRAVMDTIVTMGYNEPTTFQIIEKHKDELAAIIVEPTPLMCPLDYSDFMGELREITKRYGILLIFDEVITGFRFGYQGYQGRHGIIPDLAAYGKIIGGGLPVGAYVGREDIMEFLDHSDRSKSARRLALYGTFNGNRLTTAAGAALLAYLRDHQEIYADLEQKAKRIKKEIESHAAAIKFPFQILAAESLLVPYYHKNEIKQPRDTKWPANADMGDQFRKMLIKHGVSTGEIGAFFLSAAHSEEDCSLFIERFNSCLDEMY